VLDPYYFRHTISQRGCPVLDTWHFPGCRSEPSATVGYGHCIVPHGLFSTVRSTRQLTAMWHLVSHQICATWLRSDRMIWPSDRLHMDILTIRSSHPIAATRLLSDRSIWSSDLCHVAPFPPLDLVIRSSPRVFSMRRIWPFNRRHVDLFCASDLVVRFPPRGSFLCIGSDRSISATWLVSAH
jgi:hypothetical protein